jgi:hypothetical protein
MSRFLFAYEYINAVKAWTTFGGMFLKPEQVTMSFSFVRCDKALDALRCLKNLEPPQLPGIRAITAAPARDGLTIIIYKSVKGNDARTVPNGIKNKGWI